MYNLIEKSLNQKNNGLIEGLLFVVVCTYSAYLKTKKHLTLYLYQMLRGSHNGYWLELSCVGELNRGGIVRPYEGGPGS